MASRGGYNGDGNSGRGGRGRGRGRGPNNFRRRGGSAASRPASGQPATRVDYTQLQPAQVAPGFTQQQQQQQQQQQPQQQQQQQQQRQQRPQGELGKRQGQKGRKRRTPVDGSALTPQSGPRRGKPELQVPMDLEEEKVPAYVPGSALSRFMTNTPFSSLPLSPLLHRALKETMKIEFMTTVQEMSFPVSLAGTDILAKALTGTGKTLAFLIPVVQRLLAREQAGERLAGSIHALILSPTRELANQIAAEAKKLTTFTKFTVGVVVGGTNMGKDQKMLARFPTILIATPGRVLDHLKNTNGFEPSLKRLSAFVLDEADRMLDMGFRPDVERVVSHLSPKQSSNRQTLLFSATVPSDLTPVMRMALRDDHQFINTVPEEEEQTHLHIKQESLIVPLDAHTRVLYNLLAAACTQPNFKVLVFFTTARVTQFFGDLFERMGFPVLQIHSRKSQNYRTRVSDQFRKGSNLIMFTSDVSARGVDYPNVTRVIQIGATEVETYIHRVGRTGRIGNGGSGVLLLAPWESYVLNDLKRKSIPIEAGQLDDSAQQRVLDALNSVARDKELFQSAEQAYRAWLGFYNGQLKKLRWTKEELVRQANLFSASMGLHDPPSILKKTVGKMNLKGVAGLNVVSEPQRKR